jgi:hypothetical protein
MVMRHPVTTTLMIEALRLVQVQGLPVALGTYLMDGGCSCLDIRCTAPGLHPAAETWQLQATGERGCIESWWTEHPRASIVLPTGTHFDVLDLPPVAGSEVLRALARYPENAGPVAGTTDGRALFFVQPGARHAMAGVWERYESERAQGLDWMLRLRGRGDYVVAPPSGLGGPHSMTWLVSPYDRELGMRPLPPAASLLPLVAASCHDHAVRVPQDPRPSL